jgi:hypothetical protein
MSTIKGPKVVFNNWKEVKDSKEKEKSKSRLIK